MANAFASPRTVPRSGATRLLVSAPIVALALAALAAIMLMLGPLGYRAGWWHYRVGFTYFLPCGAFTGIAAGVVGLVGLLLGWRMLDGRRVVFALLAVVAGLVIVYVPWSWNNQRGVYPPIHDITTDFENPPQLVAVVPAREAEHGNTVVYNPKDAEQQKKAFPDIGPVELTMPQSAAFARALDAAKKLGWTIVATDPNAGTFEASQSSRWFGFTDDVAVRVTTTSSGSRIDVRSVARQGRSDFGVNARRVRAFTEALKAG